VKLIEKEGVEAWARSTMGSRLGSSFPREGHEWWAKLMGRTPVSTQLGFVQSIPGWDVSDDLARIKCPTFVITTEDQAETDRYWNAIVGNGGEESACGWCKDKWGVSWQITPVALTNAITDPDPAAAKRAFDAMMEMKRIDIAVIEAARRG
jgi:hypothetical protein